MWQDVHQAIFRDIIGKGKEAGLNSLEQVRLATVINTSAEA